MVTVPADAECRAARYIDRAAAPDAVSPYAVAAPAAPEISSLRRVIRGLPTSAGGEAGVSSDMSFLLRSRKRSGSDRTAPDRSGVCRLEDRMIAASVSRVVRNRVRGLTRPVRSCWVLCERRAAVSCLPGGAPPTDPENAHACRPAPHAHRRGGPPPRRDAR